LKTNKSQAVKIGETKLGGCPHFSKNINWPKSDFDNQYLSFLGQINLQEISKFDELKLLPKSGVLYFFFNIDSGDDGRVIYLSNMDGLTKIEPHEEFKQKEKSFWDKVLFRKGKKKILNECSVRVFKEYSAPFCDSLYVEK